jgi:DNA polymerase-3 subunit delta'
VDLIRQARADIYVQPNESDYKIYLFPRAQDMGVPGQNALLKVLEEPPKYGVFILITDNPEKLLPTVRSRCTELKMTALPENTLLSALKREFPGANGEDLSAAARRSGGFLGQARSLLENREDNPQTEGFLRGYGGRNELELAQTLVPMEKWKRDQLIPVLEQWLMLLENALASRAGLPAISARERELAAQRSSQELMAAVRSIKKALEYTQGNVSPGAVCGWLRWELR